MICISERSLALRRPFPRRENRVVDFVFDAEPAGNRRRETPALRARARRRDVARPRRGHVKLVAGHRHARLHREPRRRHPVQTDVELCLLAARNAGHGDQKDCDEESHVRKISYTRYHQVEFGTQICNALDEFEVHGVGADRLCALSRDHDIIFPWSLQYGNVRQPFNQRLTPLPLAIVYPRTAADVSFWVNFVRGHGFSVSIRSGNNSYEGLSTLNQIVIDLTFLTLDGEKQFEIDTSDPNTPLVRVASGVRLGVLYTELANAGFAFAGGQCAPVCVGGLVGSGGIGSSTRRFGWACDQLVAVECVLANGEIVTADERQHADLYRACKGAGGAGLCVLTILTLKIEPVVPILWYSVFCDASKNPLDNGAKILAEWQNLVKAPRRWEAAASRRRRSRRRRSARTAGIASRTVIPARRRTASNPSSKTIGSGSCRASRRKCSSPTLPRSSWRSGRATRRSTRRPLAPCSCRCRSSINGS